MDASSPQPAVFLVFGDLHGRILPAFRFASYWAQRTRRPSRHPASRRPGVLPRHPRMDRATIRHAKDDPLELGTLDIVDAERPRRRGCSTTRTARRGCGSPRATTRTSTNSNASPGPAAGSRTSRSTPTAAFGHQGRRRAPFDCGLRVGAIWGVDGDGPTRRKNLPPRGYIQTGRSTD